MLKDKYGREIKSIRFSVTQNCNLNCFYCHHEGEFSRGEELEFAEIKTLLEIAKQFGIKAVKFTGGEPLLRPDIVDVVETAAQLFDDVSLTTNATLLAKSAVALKKAGLTRINISLDTLRKKVYKTITGYDYLTEVIKGVEVASQLAFKPLKLNVVLLKNLNDSEIDNMLSFGKKHNAIVQFIELNPIGFRTNTVYEKYYYPLTKLEKLFAESASRIEVRELHNRKKYFLSDGEAEIVRGVHNTDFCRHCTRLRITSDGKIKPCFLRADNSVDIRTAIKEKNLKKAHELFLKAIQLREPYWK